MPLRLGWVTAGSLATGTRDLGTILESRNVARWLQAHVSHVRVEMYAPRRRYDVVVFQKAMGAREQEEAQRLQERGTSVVFDANVNYYEEWGEFDVPGTRPTPEQRRDAVAMTRLADHVVADSSYLQGVIAPVNPNVTWIPDSVDTTIYVRRGRHTEGRPFRIVWSGVAKKAVQILYVREVLRALRDVELVVVSETVPPALPEIRELQPCRLVAFSDRWYAWQLRQCDVVIAPKRIVSSYEAAHTEYKISLGMAVGLPAVASPQQSYVEAIGREGGGMIARDDEEWRDALLRLAADPGLREELGERAARTVAEAYSRAVVAPRYLELLESLR